MRQPRFLPQNAQNLRVSQHAKVAFRHERELLTKDREDNRRVVHTQRIGKNAFEAEIWHAGANTGQSINILDVLFFGKVEYIHCFVAQKFTARKSTNHLVGPSSTPYNS